MKLFVYSFYAYAFIYLCSLYIFAFLCLFMHAIAHLLIDACFHVCMFFFAPKMQFKQIYNN